MTKTEKILKIVPFFEFGKNLLKKEDFFAKTLDKRNLICYNTIVLREWRNWQTRTFEGRVVYPYGFNSRLAHQRKNGMTSVIPFFLL